MKIGITWNENLVTQRTHIQIIREAAETAMEHHRDVIIPQHFTTRGASKYGFAKRTKRTQLVKARKYHHQLPNVQTGKMRGLMPGAKVTKTQHGSRLHVRNYFPMTYERRREIEIVMPDEQQGHASRIKRLYLIAVNTPKNQRKRRVKIPRK
jgi:hypothetical protein